MKESNSDYIIHLAFIVLLLDALTIVNLKDHFEKDFSNTDSNNSTNSKLFIFKSNIFI